MVSLGGRRERSQRSSNSYVTLQYITYYVIYYICDTMTNRKK